MVFDDFFTAETLRGLNGILEDTVTFSLSEVSPLPKPLYAVTVN